MLPPLYRSFRSAVEPDQLRTPWSHFWSVRWCPRKCPQTLRAAVRIKGCRGRTVGTHAPSPITFGGDKAGSSRRNRRHHRRRQIRHTIPEPKKPAGQLTALRQRGRTSKWVQQRDLPAAHRSRGDDQPVEDLPCGGDTLRQEGLCLSRDGNRYLDPTLAAHVGIGPPYSSMRSASFGTQGKGTTANARQPGSPLSSPVRGRRSTDAL